jgi:hypothetical protein
MTRLEQIRERYRTLQEKDPLAVMHNPELIAQMFCDIKWLCEELESGEDHLHLWRLVESYSGANLYICDVCQERTLR